MPFLRASVFCVFISCLIAAGLAHAQGYAGTVSGKQASPRTSPQEEPPGYKGLIPGVLPKASADGTAAAPGPTAVPQGGTVATPSSPNRPVFTGLPARKASGIGMQERPARFKTIASVDEVILPAGLEEGEQSTENKTDVSFFLKDAAGLLPPEGKLLLENARPMRNGMFLRDAERQEDIESLLRFVQKEGLSPTEKKEARAKAKKKIQGYVRHLRSQALSSGEVYKAMKLPQNYVMDAQSSTRVALEKAEAAVKILEEQEKSR